MGNVRPLLDPFVSAVISMSKASTVQARVPQSVAVMDAQERHDISLHPSAGVEVKIDIEPIWVLVVQLTKEQNYHQCTDSLPFLNRYIFTTKHQHN